MSFKWETFKSALDHFSDMSVVYIDDEGSEIPIDCDCEFQEALRLAKLNKNCLELILYDKAKSNEATYIDHCQPTQFTANPSEKCILNKKKNVTPVSHCSSCNKNLCHSHGEMTPEWFSHYMKKFKKELLHELKSYIHDTVHSAVEKERKLSFIKSEAGEPVCEKNEILFPAVNIQGKKKKKMLERDLTDQRQIRLSKKFLSYVVMPQRPEAVERAKALQEKNLKLIESKHQYRTKCFGAEKKDIPKKSASFLRSNVEVTLENPTEFSLIIYVANDGNVRWSSPELECIEFKGLFPKEKRISLPRLYPMEKHSIVLTGKASDSPGFHYFKCLVVDNMERLSRELTCWTKVEPLQKVSSDSARQNVITTQLIDFENEVISSTQKKIEENINEIERRLQDIDLLQASTYVDINTGEATQINNKSDELQIGCDLIQNLENKNIQNEILLESNCLGAVAPSTECNFKTDSEKGKNESFVKLNEIKKDEEPESSSDSELSIIFISEEEDNFFVVPSECFSLPESGNKEKNSLVAESSITHTSSAEKTESEPNEPKIKQESLAQSNQGEASSSENFRQSQFSPTRSRCSPFGEEISKPKKMKSKSTEYCFTAANLTQPTFTQIPGFFEGKPSRFTFTGEKEKSEKSNSQNTNNIPRRTDPLRRVVYVVDSEGYIWPRYDMPESKEDQSSKGGAGKNIHNEQGNHSQPKRRNERPSDMPGVNILPNVLDGASNVASFAFNTAKSVINNLQSAFVPGGKTELGEPAYDDKMKSLTQALFTLYQMGFMDIETNRMLLTLHDNDVVKVVNELIRLRENPPEKSV